MITQDRPACAAHCPEAAFRQLFRCTGLNPMMPRLKRSDPIYTRLDPISCGPQRPGFHPHYRIRTAFKLRTIHKLLDRTGTDDIIDNDSHLHSWEH